MKDLKRHAFLILAIITFVGAFISYFVVDKGPINATDDNYLSILQTKILEEEKLSLADLGTIKSRVADKIDANFASKRIATNHPYFIFKNGQLIFWSDHRFVPEYYMVQGDYTIKNFDCDAGKFIVNRLYYKDKSDSLEIFSVINLYRFYNTLNNTKYLQSAYNPEIFASDPLDIYLSQGQKGAYDIVSANKTFLFGVEPPKIDLLKNKVVPNNIIILGVLGVLLLGIYIVLRVLALRKVRRYELAFFTLAFYLVGLRAIMLYYQIPAIFTESDIFNPIYYANNDVTPSIGDLLLNLVVAVILLLFLTNTYFRMNFYQRLIKASLIVKVFWSTICVLLSYGAMLWIYNELNQIYTSSTYPYQLDLGMSIDFYERPLKLVCLIVFILISTSYFLIIHILANHFIRINRHDIKQGLAIYTVATLLILLLCQLGSWCNTLILVLNALYFLTLYLTEFPRFLYNFKYQTSIYFFVGALVCASLSTYVVYRQEIRKDIDRKLEFGKKYLADNDPVAEDLIGKSFEKIKEDIGVRERMFQPAFASQQVNNQIRNVDLEPYLQKYKLEVTIFDKSGKNIEAPVVGSDGIDANSYQAYEKRYRQAKYKTGSSPDLYFVNETSNGFSKQYIGFVKLTNRDSTAFGYVILDLHESQFSPQTSVFSGLLESTLEQAESANFSYGVFEKGKVSSVGGGLETLNYETLLSHKILSSKELYDKGIVLNGYKHLGVIGKNGRQIVVSTKEIPAKNIYASFSFLFLLLVVSIILIIIIFAIRYGFSKLNINFATKIQIYLNIAFLLPLLLVVGITLGIISSTIRDSQDSSNMNLTKNICTKFQSYFDQYTKATLSQEYLSEQLKNAATESGRDVSLYDAKGNLLVSSKQTLYDKGLVSKFLNPEAFVDLINEKKREKLIPEQLGSLNYAASYVGMRSNEGKLMGVASVPFYDSKVAFEKQVVDVIGSILNTFTSIFIVLLLLSYFASNTLTVPLRLITQRIRKTNLDKLNEPLKWKSDDEIGLLIGEYNKMLVKLDESKQELSNNEKQTAWREMAKQVAHEIKNPLTPMKLNLQQIQRMLETDSPRAKQMMARTLGSLIDQIDNISDIANSFSEFAIMPVPRNERFDIVRVVNSSVGLYDDDHTTLKLDIPEKEINVIGDRQMMARIITNLILNGIQAVSSWRKPEISVSIKESTEHVTLEVKDNGTGIPENIRQKVFIPNFSTKKEGSGVGLAVAKRGVEHAGGSIWFDTSDDGTTFYINLPLAK